ncbi:unnamed protein product [Brassica napus]|uniref:(rape) hypothetical protein n=1 Tax=Brassica napus TaxID=3708 RepID=A0A816ILX6_BRANA|nr:unnamed protein product [Brassica napus]
MPNIRVLCPLHAWLQAKDLRLIGSWKQDIGYVGMALRTDFSIVSFPARDNLLEDQLTAF